MCFNTLWEMEPTTTCCWGYYSRQVPACQGFFAKNIYVDYLADNALKFPNKHKTILDYI